jgi:hypothetical protein
MRSFKRYIFDRQGEGFARGINFLALIEYTGDNEEDIRLAIKKANIGNIELRKSDIGKRKANSDFIKIMRGQDYDYIYLTKGDYIGVKKYEIFVYNKDYVNTYFNVKNNRLQPKTDDEDD